MAKLAIRRIGSSGGDGSAQAQNATAAGDRRCLARSKIRSLSLAMYMSATKSSKATGPSQALTRHQIRREVMGKLQ
jgi:hypothetical protein